MASKESNNGSRAPKGTLYTSAVDPEIIVVSRECTRFLCSFWKKRVTSPQTLFPSMCLFRPENTWEETRVLRGDCWEKRCFQSLKDKVGNFSFVVIFGVSWKSANIPVIRIFKMISSRREEFLFRKHFRVSRPRSFSSKIKMIFFVFITDRSKVWANDQKTLPFSQLSVQASIFNSTCD